MIEANHVPDWFREHFDRGQYIEQRYALPPTVLLIYALAFELSFEMPTAKAVKRFKGQIKQAKGSLKRTRAALFALRNSRLMPLRAPIVWHRETSDRVLEFEHGPDPTDEIVQAIDKYVEQLSLVKIERKTSALPSAVRKVNNFVDQHNPKLTMAQRKDLLHDLFDKVRERHEQYSRSPKRDRDETPRFSDVLSRLAPSRRRKIGQKVG